MPGHAFPCVYPYETRAGTRWYFAFRDAHGRQSKRRGFTSPEAADTAREQMEAAAGRGRVLVSSCRFDTWFYLWFAARKHAVSQHTHTLYKRCGRQHFKQFAEQQLTAITPDDIAGWLYHLYAGGLPAPDANQVRRVLVDCLDDAVIAGRLPSNPAREVPPLKLPQRQTKTQAGRRRSIRGGLAA